jgi:predicted transcriptional regulator
LFVLFGFLRRMISSTVAKAANRAGCVDNFCFRAQPVLQMRRKTMEKQRELSDPLTMRLPVDLLRDVETIAKTCNRTRSWVIVRALKAYLMAEGGEVLQNVKAREELIAGGGINADDLIAEIEDIIKGQA